jgi:hypothetical protein
MQHHLVECVVHAIDIVVCNTTYVQNVIVRGSKDGPQEATLQTREKEVLRPSSPIPIPGVIGMCVMKCEHLKDSVLS